MNIDSATNFYIELCIKKNFTECLKLSFLRTKFAIPCSLLNVCLKIILHRNAVLEGLYAIKSMFSGFFYLKNKMVDKN